MSNDPPRIRILCGDDHPFVPQADLLKNALHKQLLDTIRMSAVADARMASIRAVVFRVALAWSLWAWAGCAAALDPALDIGQYAHTAWRTRDGFAKGSINAFAQTPDGYLWLGTNSELLRFDGVRSVPWQPPEGQSLPDKHVAVLAGARDGTLWIGTFRGLVAWNGHQLVRYPSLDGYSITSILQDHDGTVWVSAARAVRESFKAGLVCAIRAAGSECQGADGSLGSWTGSLYEDSRGTLWVASSRGVWRWKPGPPSLCPIVDVTDSYQSLAEAATGALLVVVNHRIQRLDNGKFDALPLPAEGNAAQPDQLARDRDGATWIGTRGRGLLHVHGGRMDAFTHSDGLSGDTIVRMFEDREGTIWIATTEGIDRFRMSAATTYSALQGLSGYIAATQADPDGSIWISTMAGLYRWHDGRMSVYRPRSHDAPSAGRPTPASSGTVDTVEVPGLPELGAATLFRDRRGRLWLGSRTTLGVLEHGHFTTVSVSGGYVDSIAQDNDGSLWIARREAGLQKISGDRVVQQVSWNEIAPRGPAWRLATDPVRGGVWLGFFSGGIAHVVDGRAGESYSASEGLGKGIVNHVRSDPDGSVWVATEGGLSRLKSGRIATLDSKSGLPCDGVDSSAVGDDGSAWVYMQCGMARIARRDLDAWSAAVDGGQRPPTIRTTVLDASDGVLGSDRVGTYSPHLALAPDRKVLFTTIDGVSALDPSHLPFNRLPPPVHVERVDADRKVYDGGSPLRLPPLVRDLQIDYTALSFVAPEKNQFRYKLEGRDPDWQDAGNRRQAFYADLDPGHYRFRVIASNNSGVWNEQGATLEFSIAPAYWQTNWFRALCAAAFIALLWTLHVLRARQLARHFNLTLEARVNERTRIARDLHDTLLQSFHGLLLRFQTAREMFASRPTDALKVLDDAIDLAADAITEGRDAVQGLRSSTEERNDLADAIQALGGALSTAEGADAGPALRIDVHGEPRELHPIVRDELMRIAGEAMRNAFRHAAAKHVEVEIHYGDRRMRVRVRDDGKGIAAGTLQAGAREGHFGLPGMRERARLVGGKLTVWTGLGTGTEIDVSVPAAHAYASFAPTTGWRAWIGSILHPRTEAPDS